MSVFKVRYYSPALRRQVCFNAVLPLDEIIIPENMRPDIPKYEKKRDFKTVYLLHGYGGNDDDWLHGSNIDFLSLKYNLAFVMPSVENSFYLDDPARQAFYSRFLCEEIIDFTRKAFSLSHKREDTAICGLSMGGYGALRNGLLRPDVFGAIVAFSSALITDEISELPPGVGNEVASYEYYRHIFGPLDALKGSDKDPKALAKRLKESGAELPRIYMACGTEDFLLDRNRDMHRCLQALNIPHDYHESPGTHVWSFWDEYIDKSMSWFVNTGSKD
nr:FAE1 [uncultured bacterium]